MLTIDSLAQEIRRVDGNHTLGAGALAEALMTFLSALSDKQAGETFTREQMLAEVERRVERALAARSALVDVPAVEPIQMHRTRHKISELAGWSDWSKWEEGFGQTDDPTFEIEIENRIFYTSPPLPHRGEDSAEVFRSALQRISELTPARANAKDARDLHHTVKAIADAALAVTPSGSAIKPSGDQP